LRLRHVALPAALAFALAPLPAASARVALVATGTPELALLDVSTDQVVARLALPAPSTAVAVDSEGARGFVAAGATIVSLDVNERTESGRVADGGPPVTGLAVSPDGARLYAVQGDRLRVRHADTLALIASVDLKGRGRALGLGRSGRVAAVGLDGGRVAIVDTRAKRLLRRVSVPGATGVAVAPDGSVLVTARGRLRSIAPRARRVGGGGLRLPRGAGGDVALSPGRTRLAIGARKGGRSGALVVLRSSHVRRLSAGGSGIGTPAWTPDANRLFFANRGAGALSLVSPFSRGLLDTVRLPGSSPRGIVVQPGLALIRGTPGDDTLIGTRSRDRIEGLEGNDLLRGGRDRDVLEGGPGNDSLSGGALSDRMSGGEGDDFLTAGTGNDTVTGGSGDDTVDGGTGNDTIDGEEGDDQLDGGDGDDTIRGGEGDDAIVEKGFGNDKLLSGGPGDDVVRGGRGSDRRMLGDDGNDELFGESGTDQMSGGRGDDVLDGGTGGDNMIGDEGEDILRGGRGNDRLDGGPGQDRLDGSSGSDDLQGGDDNDEVVGGPGVDVLRGGPGDDSIRAADDSADTVECGDGNDTVYVEADAPTRDKLSDCELVVAVPAEAANDAELPSIIRGTLGDDLLQGTDDDDSMFGKAGMDRLFGRGGDDYVDGEDGDDELHGGPGNDIIAGRDGADEIHGDAGNDRITGDRGNDRIYGDDGNDEIFGNLDPDVIEGGAGDDRINVVAGSIDAVSCGPGKDTVFASAGDVVNLDCEDVRR
jgi:Ca2+-binding RTX toxin-like protein